MELEIIMPKIGFSEGKIALNKWLKKEGDAVETGEAIAEIEGEKITNVVEAEQKGVVSRLCVAEGEEVSIGDTIAVLEV